MQNTNPPFSPKLFLRTISIIHLALVAGVLAFGLVMFFITPNQKLDFTYNGDVMFFIVPILAIGGIIVGDFIFRKNINVLAAKHTLREKLEGYLTASIIKYALLEGPALFALVNFMNDDNQYYLITAIFLLGWLIMQRPTRDKIESDLMLEGKLKNEFAQEDLKTT